MIKYILSLALLTTSLRASLAFPAFAPHKARIQRFATKSSNDANPTDPANIDIERAIDCAEHFGKCSKGEMQQLRDGLHKERLQTMIYGGGNVAPEESFQHHLLEEELSLQLSLLNDVTPAPTMFPEAEDTEKDAPVHSSVGEKILMVEEAIVEENLGDALAICVVLGVLIAAPHLLQL